MLRSNKFYQIILFLGEKSNKNQLSLMFILFGSARFTHLEPPFGRFPATFLPVRSLGEGGSPFKIVNYW
ncbi:hypothetical protein A3I30_00465 [Candidatus Azambacteria bacterium RIFCSPLOWO2_02_FULL_44_14]|uniref:Uncharacterized protein n=1 Tax=Candidatus Azambacteria bacterium RIFCSPLOWO2_02_FULL_44_14 TaxID=1797306 RepID=A0A1F5CAL0_9BACT|nr:MAG: hypothetical protein A3I30_00465 [Candidatus Azambacteria bacterium RIFCSPLOWO2_02_FULL_44_14]